MHYQLLLIDSQYINIIIYLLIIFLLLIFYIVLKKYIKNKRILKAGIIGEQNVQNVLFICMVITQKYYEDEIFKDKDYCKMKNIKLDVLIEMQMKLLEMLNFSLHINEKDFIEYKNRMKNFWKKHMIYLCYS